MNFTNSAAQAATRPRPVQTDYTREHRLADLGARAEQRLLEMPPEHQATILDLLDVQVTVQ